MNMGMGISERSKGGALFALLLCGGCGVAAPVASEAAAVKLRCPDPKTDCTQSNGTGVYTGEDGHAWIDDSLELMITGFQNESGKVTFQGRYFSAPQKWWLPLPSAGSVWSADYEGQTDLTVKAVTEKATLPEWTLEDSAGNVIPVVGAKMVNLKLHLSFAEPSTGKIDMYVIGFDAAVDEPGHRVVHKYNMNWHLEGSSAPQQYCFDANGKGDMVVFQRGLFVNPTSAAVTRDATTTDYVMLSCRLGGPATVWWWGYPYLGTSDATFFFDSGLQMKRASYCADSNHYTKTGTLIHIADSSKIEDNPILAVEAFWTPTGATCIGKMRHPELGFNGTCNGVALGACPTLEEQFDQPGEWIGDGIE
jgi:hypothetical protein